MADHNNGILVDNASDEQFAGMSQFMLRDLDADWRGHHHASHQPPTPTPPPSTAIEYRSIDGSGNNLENSQFNATGSDFARVVLPILQTAFPYR